MKVQEVIKFWLESAEDDLDTAEKLFEARKYHHCLFFCHLFLEKGLKALAVSKTGEHAQPIHDLTRLAKTAKVKLGPRKEKQLNTISRFNIKARYNSYKFKFYKQATKKYTLEWFNRCKEIYQWLKKQI